MPTRAMGAVLRAVSRVVSGLLGRVVFGVVAVSMATLAAAADPPSPDNLPAPPDTSADLIVVAVRDAPQSRPAVGGTPTAPYGGRIGYAGSTRALAEAESVALDHGLREVSAWTIAPLQWRCMLYRLPPGVDRADVLAALARDPRVQLAQPLNEFETLAQPPAEALPYDDPYVSLQRGFAAMHVAEAQRWSRGDGVRIAVIDTGIDATHPDLRGRIAAQRDFVAADHPPAAEGERHGTEIAGVIAAGANNGIGIVGVAPLARLLAYRACWPLAARDAASRCNSFTLARALGAAIADGADVINLSLGGPPDALLRTLAEYAMQRGAIVVGALPASGRAEGFPAGVAGVVAVGAGPTPGSDTASDRRVLRAPGYDILTLVPGGRYDYASGSSLAAAHVSGVVALLRALDPALRSSSVGAALVGGAEEQRGGAVDACRAVRRSQAAARCLDAEVDTGARDLRSLQP